MKHLIFDYLTDFTFRLFFFIGKMIHSMVAHLDAVTSLAVDPNGLYLLSGSKSCICVEISVIKNTSRYISKTFSLRSEGSHHR